MRQFRKLNATEMKSVKVGVSKEEYCNTIMTIMLNPENHANGNISKGACEGAAEGARRAGCSFTINCNY